MNENGIGLKRGTVELLPHRAEWDREAKQTAERLRGILGDTAVAIEHVGSTAIPAIRAKPIIDLMVSVEDFKTFLSFEPTLRENGFFYRENADIPGELLFACGDYYTGGEEQTHFIHVVKAGSMNERNYRNFRDCLNAEPIVAKEYEALKIQLMEQFRGEPTRAKYCSGKASFIGAALRRALSRSFLGETVQIQIDRPVGYVHRKEGYSLTYPINYGYIPGVFSPDDEELDVYLLGVQEPLEAFTGKVIAVIHREDDVEDKLVMCPPECTFTKSEVASAVHFQEQYYKTHIEMLHTN